MTLYTNETDITINCDRYINEMNIIGAVGLIQSQLCDEEIIVHYKTHEIGMCDMCSEPLSNKDCVIIVNKGVRIIEVCCNCALLKEFTDEDDAIQYFITVQESKLRELRRMKSEDKKDVAYYMAHE